MVRTWYWLVLLTLALSVSSACGDGDGETGEACASRADCPDGQRCNEAGVCSTQTLSCDTLNDCAPDEFCNADGVCDARACSEDADCGPGAFCLEGNGGALACQLGGCREDSDCAGGKVCSEFNTCTTEGCTVGSCGPFQRCDDAQSPPACAFTQDCGGSNADAICVAWARQEGQPEDDFYCESATQKCTEKPPCGDDNDCASDEICEPRDSDDKKVCTEGCRANRDCRSGEICDTTPGVFACVPGCDNDDDCERNDGNTYACADLVCVKTCSTRNDCTVEGQICSGSPRICKGCTADNQCPATEECEIADGMDEGLCVPLPPECPDDGLGDNHAAERAHEISSFPFEHSVSGGNPLKFCQSNAGGDWFEFAATGGDVIEVTLTYDERQGNLDIGLIRPDGTGIVASTQPPSVDGGTETIRYGVELGAVFRVQVRGTIPSTNIDYGLRIDVAPPPACTDDALEPNSSTAPAALDADVAYSDLETCGGAADFYLLDVGLNQIVTARAEAPVNLGNIDLLLYSWDASTSTLGPIVAQAQTARDVEELLFSTDTGGEFVLEVRVTSGVGNVLYDLEWSQQENNCADVFEPNDACASASPLAAGSQAGLNLCPDGDYYEVELLPLQTLTVTATYPLNASGDLDLNLYGPNDCAVLAAGETQSVDANGITSTLTYQAQQGGVFVVAATLFQGLRVSYDIDVELIDGPACVNDGFDNNDPTTARVIDHALAEQGQDNVITGGKLCDLEADYYAIDLEYDAELDVGDSLQWVVSFDQSIGDVDAAIVTVDDQGVETVVATADSTTDDESLSFDVTTAADAGTYYLKVFGKFAVRNEYWVLTYLNEGAPVDPDCPDSYENNDERAAAQQVDPGSYSLLVCGLGVGAGAAGDADWFTTFVAAGETLTVDLAFLNATGNVNLALYDDSGSATPLVQSQTLADSESVTYTSSRDQYLVWRITTLSSGALVPYEMTVDVVAAPPCATDRFDPNGTFDAAEAIDAPGLYDRLVKCEDDVDWFAVDLEEGVPFEAYLNYDRKRADLQVRVYDQAAPTVPLEEDAADPTNPRGDGGFVFTPPTTGTYLIEISSATRARVPYDLLLYVDGDGPEDWVCPDPFENNDATNTARRIPVGSYEGLLLCWSNAVSVDRDFYEVFVPRDATLSVDLSFTHAEGDLQLRVSQGTTTVGQSLTADDNESVVVTNTGAGAYYKIQVFGGTGAFVSRYDLDVSLSFADVCAEDSVAGPSQAGALVASTGAYADLVLCEGTEDWIELPAGTTMVEAYMELSNKLGDLDLELWSSTGVVVASATTSNEEAIVLGGLSPTETYFLRVLPKNGAFVRNAYDLWLSVDGQLPALPYCPDGYERNDEQASAEELSGATLFTEMIACAQDRDWYSLPGLSSNNTYALNVFFDQSTEVDLAVSIHDATGAAIEVTEAGAAMKTTLVDSADDDELLTFSPPGVGTYYLLVENKLDGQAPYNVYFQRSGGACLEDGYEDNDSDFDPKAITVPFDEGLWLCDAQDTFSITPTSADPITIVTRFDGESLNMGLKVFDNNTLIPVTGGVDNSTSGSRRTVTFTPVPDTTYGISIGQKSGTTGPYFLHISQ